MTVTQSMPNRISIQIQSHTISIPSRSKHVNDLGLFFRDGKSDVKEMMFVRHKKDPVTCSIIHGA